LKQITANEKMKDSKMNIEVKNEIENENNIDEEFLSSPFHSFSGFTFHAYSSCSPFL
jgi:hypothetical protein